MDRLVDGDWLQRELGAPDLRILDCSAVMQVVDGAAPTYVSGRARWERVHIPGSGHADLVEISDRASPFPLMLPPLAQFAAAMNALGVGEGVRVVLYDSALNVFSARMWWMLRAYGFDDAAVLDGGWRAWVSDGRPVSSERGAPTPAAEFAGHLRHGTFIGSADVVAALNLPDVSIVNALPRALHRGEVQGYLRRGHIPGSSNAPYGELVDPATHRYLPRDGLRRVLGERPATTGHRVIAYCGHASPPRPRPSRSGCSATTKSRSTTVRWPSGLLMNPCPWWRAIDRRRRRRGPRPGLGRARRSRGVASGPPRAAGVDLRPWSIHDRDNYQR